MKRILLLLSFLSSFNFIAAQTFSSNNLCNTNMIRIYRNDAERLAVKRIFDNNWPYKDSINIPLAITDSILKNLALVHNIPVSPFRDTLISIFGSFNNDYYYAWDEDSTHVHYGIFSLRKFEISVDQNATWADQWIQGNYTNTVNPQVNQIMNAYGLAVSSYITLPGKRVFYLRAARNFNMYALKNLFNTIAGVTNTNLTYPFGTGCKITYTVTNNEVFMDYHFQCGDCPSGCTYGITWNFKTNTSNSTVNYIGRSDFMPAPGFGGDKCDILIPPGGYSAEQNLIQNCTVESLVNLSLRNLGMRGGNYSSEYKIYPNPGASLITLELPKNLPAQKRIIISDLAGRVVQETNINNRNIRPQLNLGSLVNGIYTITILTHSSSHVYRFIKQ